MTQYFLIFDIETTGLPKVWDAPVEEFDNWPNILEIAWQLFNDRKELINEKSFIIRPDKYEISEEIESLTGISNKEAMENGIPIWAALQDFLSILIKFKPILVAHNSEFDVKVVEAHLIHNKFSSSLKPYGKICTMKESTFFCKLPNFKYPKLNELYEVLFLTPPTNLHRALDDVRTTSKSFFKLIELGIIDPPKVKSIIDSDFEFITIVELNMALENYIEDINKYPLFYELNNISTAINDNLSEFVNAKFNKFHPTEMGKTFEIPYNQVINRTVIALNPNDIVIRYLLINYLKRETNFFTSSEKYDQHTIIKLCERHLIEGRKIVIKVDINNCYESISHEKLIVEIAKELDLDNSSNYIKILNNSLKVIYKDLNGQIKQKERGLLIGSKPDEYLAEFFLEKITDCLKVNGIHVLRIADEFIYFSSSFSDARENFKLIKDVIESFHLSINNSKTIITDHRENVLNNKLDFKVVNASSDPVLIYKLFDLDSFDNKMASNDLCRDSESSSNLEIVSYELALIFLKQMLLSQASVEKYQKEHPDYKYLNNIRTTLWSHISNDLLNTNTTVFNKKNVEKLKKVIFYYPKSEYYTAMAIQLLVFLAKNSILVIDKLLNENTELENIELRLHETCISSNLTIIELLGSVDIHEYQKYILLRCLFKKHNSLLIDVNEYKVMEVYKNVRYRNQIFNKIPFKEKILNEVEILNINTNYYPLKMICTELIRININNK